MKKLSKVLVLVLSAIMVLAMSASVFAATGDITVNGPVEGATYEAYLMFDATTSGSNVSYTIPSGSTITSVTDFSTYFETKTNGGKTYVTRKSGVTDDEIVAWVKSNASAIRDKCGAAKATAEGSGSSVTLATGLKGWFMVYSSKGEATAVSVGTTSDTATVNSKLPNTPSIDTTTGKKINGKVADTLQVGEEATFTVTFTATNYEVADGVSTPITEYVITDTAEGFTLDTSSISVKVNDSEYAISGKSVTVNNGVITIPWDQTTYNTSNTVVVTYKGTLTNAKIAGESKNTAALAYKKGDTSVNVGSSTVYAYNYKINVTKVDKSNTESKLEGAKFVLKNSDSKFYKVGTNGVVSWVESQTDATEVTTDTYGAASFAGLGDGSYTLVETQAPEGYNLAADTEVSLAAQSTKLSDVSVLTVSATVKDEAGTVLPGTGGIGTTIFYVLGSLLVIGCGIVLVSRKRMGSNK